jgi:hypothetical protein
MARFDGKYGCVYPHYKRDQLKPEYRQEPEGIEAHGKMNSVMVVSLNGVVLHSYQCPAISTVGKIQAGLSAYSELHDRKYTSGAEVLALFQGIDYDAYSKIAAKVCSKWLDPKGIISGLEKAILLPIKEKPAKEM